MPGAVCPFTISRKLAPKINDTSKLSSLVSSTGCPKKKETPSFPYISVRINTTVPCFIWAVKGCPPVRFAYRQRSERQAVPEIFWFWF